MPFKKGHPNTYGFQKGHKKYAGCGAPKGIHNSPKTEFKKGERPSIKTEFKEGGGWKGIFKENHPKWKGSLTKNQKLELRAGRKKPDKCELCGRQSKRICFDHNHKTDKFRGWICNKCNIALGMVNDNIQTLELMIEYIKNNNID